MFLPSPKMQEIRKKGVSNPLTPKFPSLRISPRIFFVKVCGVSTMTLFNPFAQT